MQISQGSHLSSHVVPRSLPRLVPASQNAVQRQAASRGPGCVHRQQQIHGASYHFSDRRASSVPDAGNGISKSDLENSTDEAATRVGLSSKGSKKLAGFWGAYSKALEEHPIRVKSATSFFGFLLGDAVAQLVVGNPYNYLRTARMVIFGILMDGPIGHLWYTFLDGKVYPEDPKSNKAVISKMLCDQLLWAPFFSCVFFAVIKTLEGTPALIIPTIKAKLVKTLLANYAMWPLAHIINFKFIPSKQRILYINCVQVIWSAYLSNMSCKA
ncbi:hypothetical protein WJX82_004728 [Trebouxia sp. C0006]